MFISLLSPIHFPYKFWFHEVEALLRKISIFNSFFILVVFKL